MSKKEKIWAIIPAAGIGTRMQSETPKQYLKIQDKYILEYTLERFCFHPLIEGVVVALAEGDPYWPNLSISSHEKIMIVNGGVERCHSVLNGLKTLVSKAKDTDWVMVHDAARPCLRDDDIEKLISTVSEKGLGGILAVPVRDTMKRVDNSNCVSDTVDRTGLWHALTPQMFRLTELTLAIESALDNGIQVTDEAQALELLNTKPQIIEGHPDNIKITHPEDLLLADLFLSQQGKLS
jgi:2-C-methyl-D-erythritol 4-phosphate cytidylyltransferase